MNRKWKKNQIDSNWNKTCTRIKKNFEEELENVGPTELKQVSN